MFGRAGVAEVTVVAGTAVVTNFGQADKLFHLSDGMMRARDNEAITEAAATRWRRGIEERDLAGQFCCAVTGFVVAGRRP